ncbi:patatin-like phospholipase family protein [Rhodobacteraceae bacterium D3-12]|nr:patatin-like phospholipase family protein [Rhodobacteraceae bacterium D3-12]
MIRINLALQGGGAHGAFTWGVLDRLLQEPDIEISGISGTSAGALNGAALKSGWLSGGAQGARDNLDWLWSQMGALSNPELADWFQGMTAHFDAVMEAPWPMAIFDAAARLTTPYAFGPFYQNPLRPVVEAFHYDKVCAASGPALFVGSTNVKSGKIRIFEQAEISTDALLASACLPTLFQAVEIAGEHYWDGGYSGNPALFPLFEADLPDDIVVININPLYRDDIPKTPQQIQNRINEISFNSSLLRELRAIRFAQRLLSKGAVPKGVLKDVKVHMIADDDLMNDLSVSTKLMPNPLVLARLKKAGQAAAERFLDAHKSDLGKRGTIDLQEALG